MNWRNEPERLHPSLIGQELTIKRLYAERQREMYRGIVSNIGKRTKENRHSFDHDYAVLQREALQNIKKYGR